LRRRCWARVSRGPCGRQAFAEAEGGPERIAVGQPTAGDHKSDGGVADSGLEFADPHAIHHAAISEQAASGAQAPGLRTRDR